MTKIECQKILLSLSSLYKKLYPSKNAFAPSLFKYSIEQVDTALELLPTATQDKIYQKKKNVSKKKSTLLDTLKSKYDAETFYQEHMLYERGNELSEKNLIKKYSKAELQHIYILLYGIKSPSSATKSVLFKDIQRYFDNIERARGFF